MSEQNTAAIGALQMVTAPKFVASGFNISVTPTEIVVLCTSLVPGHTPAGDVVSGLKPEVILSMSPQAAMELVVVLRDLLPSVEKDIGEITTPFLRERAKK
jgi:hypothetical protein